MESELMVGMKVKGKSGKWGQLYGRILGFVSDQTSLTGPHYYAVVKVSDKAPRVWSEVTCSVHCSQLLEDKEL